MSRKVIAVINMKGGVGKTTLTWNIAIDLYEKYGKRVLLIDLDPQANATILGLSEDELEAHIKTKKTIADLFINCYKKYGPFPKPEPEKITDYSIFLHRLSESDDKSTYLDLFPSELHLSSVLKGAYVDPFMLDDVLKSRFFDKYDYILIDCAPTNSILTTLALNAAKNILVPVMADTFAVYGAELMKEVMDQHYEDYNIKVNPIGLVFTRLRKNNPPQYQDASKVKIVNAWGSTTFKTEIRDTPSYGVANGKHTGISESGARQEVKDEFDDFMKEFLEKTDKL